MENKPEKKNQQLQTEHANKEYSDISSRMKNYENESLSVIKIPPFLPFIVRLDRKNFSKFTVGMRKSFDILFTKAMLLTTSDLVTELTAATGYSHSDEISLIFLPSCSPEEFDKSEEDLLIYLMVE